MEEFAASVSGERAASLGSDSTTIVSPATTQRRQSKPGDAHGSGVLVALGTLAVVLALALIGVPRLQSTAGRASAERSTVAAAPRVSRLQVKKSGPAKLRAVDYSFLSVRSSPRALLYIDGSKVGLTPITNHRLKAGTYRLRVEQKGYQKVAETIVIKSSRPVNRRYELRRQSGR
jgi:hypothetical protein